MGHFKKISQYFYPLFLIIVLGLAILSPKTAIKADEMITSVTVGVGFVIEETVSETVDTGGGEVTLATETGTTASVSLPAGALPQTAEISISSITKTNITPIAPFPADLDAVGGLIYNFEARVNGEPVTTFDQPVSLTFTYTDSQAFGIDESTIKVYYWSEDQERWVFLPDYELNEALNTISATTSHFTLFITMGFRVSPPAPGGGGLYVPPSPETKVILQGKAYPDVLVTILKDGQIAAAIRTDNQGNFQAELSDMAAGLYTFGVWAEDRNRVKSIISSFTVNVTRGMATTISNIILPPTISLERNTITKGEILNIFGFSVPESEIELFVDSETKQSARASNEGAWRLAVDSNILDEGEHFIKARTIISEQKSIFSFIKSFFVGAAPPEKKCDRSADINGDSQVNMIDFTILLYNWDIPKNPRADFNCDSKVNMREISIMMHFWTG